MSLFDETVRLETRRQFFARGKNVLGCAALGALFGELPGARAQSTDSSLGRPDVPHFPPRIQQVIYLHMVGGPSQMDLYDYKPVMSEWYDKDLPDSVRMGQRLTTMTSGQKRFPVAPSVYQFAQHGKCGMWVSEMLPWTARCVDDMAFIRSMHTEAITH